MASIYIFQVRTTSPLSKTSVHLKSGTGGTTVILMVILLFYTKSSKLYFKCKNIRCGITTTPVSYENNLFALKTPETIPVK